MTNPTIVAILIGIYLAAVFVGSLAFLRMRRENQGLHDRIEAMERERYHQRDIVSVEHSSNDAEP